MLLISCAALAQTSGQHKAKVIHGSGCVEIAAPGQCRILIDTKTGETFDLLFSTKAPKSGTAIQFKATPHSGTTACTQGKPVNVTSWKKEKGIKCPPPSKPGQTH